MNTKDVKCPICGTVNRCLDLDETDGWMECESCSIPRKTAEREDAVSLKPADRDGHCRAYRSQEVCSCQKSLCGDGQNRCAYKARRLGSRYQQGVAAKAHPAEQRSWYSVQRIAASFAKPEPQSNTKTVAGTAHSRKSNKCWKYKRCSMVYCKIVPWKSCLQLASHLRVTHLLN